MKKNRSDLILSAMLLIGLSLLLYPTLSDYWNSFRQTRVVARYTQAVAQIEDDQYGSLWADARRYNQTLVNNKKRYHMSDRQREVYNGLLNITGDGVMGYVEIPSIKCTLPIYHGVEDTVLQAGVGHIEGSSLPVGGEGTHSVLSSHRGLPSAKLFTDLDKLAEGDTFMLRILDETLTYEVDQIHIVLPEEMEDLEIDPKMDYCTLVTCTPYGVNSHRLLVRGHRIETAGYSGPVRVTADAVQIEPLIVAPIVALPMLLLLLAVLMAKTGRNKKEPKEDERK